MMLLGAGLATLLSNLFLIALRGKSFEKQCQGFGQKERESKFVASFLSPLSPIDARLTLPGAVTLGFTLVTLWLVGYVLFSFTSTSVMYSKTYSDRPGLVEESLHPDEQAEIDAAR